MPTVLRAVVDVFRQNFEERGDVGASFAVTRAGELVVDIWAGHLDEERTVPWQHDTSSTSTRPPRR